MDGTLIAKNKKAYFDYEILEKVEAGIVLTGAEVKSVKSLQIQLKGSFASIHAGRITAENLHISPYKFAPAENFDPLRRKALLLKRKEIEHLAGLSQEQGLTIIPLEVILKRGFVKILLGLCRGKKKYDKRDTLKKRSTSRDIDQGLKKFSR